MGGCYFLEFFPSRFLNNDRASVSEIAIVRWLDLSIASLVLFYRKSPVLPCILSTNLREKRGFSAPMFLPVFMLRRNLDKIRLRWVRSEEYKRPTSGVGLAPTEFLTFPCLVCPCGGAKPARSLRWRIARKPLGIAQLTAFGRASVRSAAVQPCKSGTLMSEPTIVALL